MSFDDPADGLKLSAGSDAKICTQPQVVLSLWSVKCLFVLHHAPHYSIICCQVFVICRSYHLVCLSVHTASHPQTAWFSFRVSSATEDFHMLSGCACQHIALCFFFAVFHPQISPCSAAAEATSTTTPYISSGWEVRCLCTCQAFSLWA